MVKGKNGFIPPIFILIALIALAIWGVSALISGIGNMPLSIIGSYDAYDTEFDPYSTSDICQGLDSEYEIVTETFARNSTLKLSADSKVRMFCGIGSEIYYDDYSNTVNIGKLDSITDYIEIDIGYRNYTLEPLNNGGNANFLDVFNENGQVIETEKFIGPQITGCNQSVTRYLEHPLIIKNGQEFSVSWASGKYYSPKYHVPFDYESIEITSIQQITGKPYPGETNACAPAIPDKLYFNKESWPNNQITLTYAVPKESIPTNIHYREESCPLPEGYVLATETFKSGSTFSAETLRYPPSYFCKRHPVLVTTTSDSSTQNCPGPSCKLGFDPYDRLVDGGSLTVGADETMTVFYVISANEDLPIVCDVADSTFDAETGRCVKKVTGVLHVCSEGNFDPSTGLCLVQADTKYACDIGRYDTVQQKCIYNPPVQAVCPDPTTQIYDPDSGKCKFTPDIEEVCPEGSTLNDEGLCEVYPDSSIVCQEGFSYQADIDKCIKYADTEYQCDDGYYDTLSKTCVINPPEQAVCERGAYIDGACIYTPDLHQVCPQGSYDSDKDACIVTPNIEYLCINGVYDPNQQVCVIAPAETIYCRDGFTYDQATDKCVRYPDSAVRCLDGYTYNPDEDVCQMTPDQEIDCPDTTRYEKGKCIYEPDVAIECPDNAQYDSSLDKCVVTKHTIVCNEGYEYDDELKSCVKKGKMISWYEAFLIWLKNLF